MQIILKSGKEFDMDIANNFFLEEFVKNEQIHDSKLINIYNNTPTQETTNFFVRASEIAAIIEMTKETDDDFEIKIECEN